MSKPIKIQQDKDIKFLLQQFVEVASLDYYLIRSPYASRACRDLLDRAVSLGLISSVLNNGNLEYKLTINGWDFLNNHKLQELDYVFYMAGRDSGVLKAIDGISEMAFARHAASMVRRRVAFSDLSLGEGDNRKTRLEELHIKY